MAAASAAGQFEHCMVLREQINVAKRQALEAQMNEAAAAGQFERCIQLREEMSRLI